MSLVFLLKNWPRKIEIEEEFMHLIKNNCVPGNSVYSMTIEMEIQFKLSQLFPLTPADHAALKSLPVFLGNKVIGIKLFSSLMLRSIIIFPLSLSKNGDCRAIHSTIYMLLSYYYFMFLILMFPTPQLCFGPQQRSNTDVWSIPSKAEHSSCCFSRVSYGP